MGPPLIFASDRLAKPRIDSSTLVYPMSTIVTVAKSIRHLMTLPFRTAYFQNFCKKYFCKTTGATIMKKVPKNSKLIYVINILTVR